jgi:hypothetical protein
MSDLSQPPLPPPTALALGYAWPTPDLAGYPPPSVPPVPPACYVEGTNGHRIEGTLTLFDPERGLLQLRMNTPRRPLPLRLDQFRRLCLAEPLAAGFDPEDTLDLDARRPLLPFEIDFKGAPRWQGHTVGHREEPWGLFLFEPLDDEGTVRRWFVPREAYRHADVGVRIGQALVDQDSATPEQIRQALAEHRAAGAHADGAHRRGTDRPGLHHRSAARGRPGAATQ